MLLDQLVPGAAGLLRIWRASQQVNAFGFLVDCGAPTAVEIVAAAAASTRTSVFTVLASSRDRDRLARGVISAVGRLAIASSDRPRLVGYGLAAPVGLCRSIGLVFARALLLPARPSSLFWLPSGLFTRLANSGLQQTKTSLRSAFAAEACYVSRAGEERERLTEYGS
jgi:hypothetical protein